MVAMPLHKGPLHEAPPWEALYAEYERMVRGWLARHPQCALTGKTAEALVNALFSKMWSALNPDKFARFDNLPALLCYLKLIIYASYVLGETPRALYAHEPERFGSFQEIYELKHNILKRLGRNLQLPN